VKVIPKRPIEILSPSEVQQLIAQCSTRAPTGLRDAALIAVLYRGSLAPGGGPGALSARAQRRTWHAVRIHNGKGHKPRTVGLDATAFGLIDRWVRKKGEVGLDPRATLLFCTLAGNPIAPPNVREMLKRRAEKAGIDKRVHPYGLRHTHAMELIADEHVPLNALQKQLGHSNLATPLVYVDHLGAQDVIAIGQKRSKARAVFMDAAVDLADRPRKESAFGTKPDLGREPALGSVDNKIHIYNSTNNPVHVIVRTNPAYVLGNLVSDIFVFIAVTLITRGLLSQHASPKLCTLVQGFSCYTGILSSYS